MGGRNQWITTVEEGEAEGFLGVVLYCIVRGLFSVDSYIMAVLNNNCEIMK